MLVIVWPFVGRLLVTWWSLVVRFGHRLAVSVIVRRFGSVSAGLVLLPIGVLDGEQDKLGPEPERRPPHSTTHQWLPQFVDFFASAQVCSPRVVHGNDLYLESTLLL